MRIMVYLAGVSTLFLAGWLALIAWGVDKVGQAGIEFGSPR